MKKYLLTQILANQTQIYADVIASPDEVGAKQSHRLRLLRRSLCSLLATTSANICVQKRSFSKNYVRLKPKPSHPQCGFGFTLLEVIISLVIFVIGVLAVFYLFPMGLKASKKAELISKVSILSQKKLESTKAAGFQVIDPLSPQIPLEGTEANLKWKLSLRNVSPIGTAEGSLREVMVTIFWTEEGKERSRSFLTYVAD